MDASGAQAIRASADGQAAWSRPLDAGVKFAEMNGERRWLKSPRHRGERGAAEKNHRAGDAGSFRLTCSDYARELSTLSAREAADAAGARHSPRSLSFEGHGFLQGPGAICAAAMRALAVLDVMPRESGDRPVKPDDDTERSLTS